MPWCTLLPPDSVQLALSRGAGGFEVGGCGRSVGRFTVQCSLSMPVGRLSDGRVTVLFADMVAGGRGASRRLQLDGRRSPFDPCMPGWFGVGRLACGLFTVKWRLQLRCGRCAVVLAASWSAWSAWVLLRCCRWSYCRMLLVHPCRPCRRLPVASWLVRGRRSAVCQRWLAASVMVELRCSALSVGMVAGGRGAPGCRLPVGRRSRLDPCTPGWSRVGRLACGLFTVMWRLQLRCGWCAVVAAASWSAGFVWVPSRCWPWPHRQILPM